MKLLDIFGLELTTRPSALVTYFALFCLATLVERKRGQLPLASSVAVGLTAAATHAASVLFHHFGHAAFARYTGHPMTGVRLWGGLATSVYPTHEPPLAPSVHLTRAAGGPLASVVLAIIMATLRSRTRKRSAVISDLTLLAVLDNLLVLGVGSLAPLSFTDGSTLLEWSRRAH